MKRAMLSILALDLANSDFKDQQQVVDESSDNINEESAPQQHSLTNSQN
jgi:hypothetical protein